MATNAQIISGAISALERLQSDFEWLELEIADHTALEAQIRRLEARNDRLEEFLFNIGLEPDEAYSLGEIMAFKAALDSVKESTP